MVFAGAVINKYFLCILKMLKLLVVLFVTVHFVIKILDSI